MPYGMDEAKAHAEQVGGSCDFQYNQALDIRSKVGGSEVNQGWCHAVAIMWIKKGFTGEDFLSWFGPGQKACPQYSDESATVGPVFSTLKMMMSMQSLLVDVYNQQSNRSWWARDYVQVKKVTQHGLSSTQEGMRNIDINKSANLMVDTVSEHTGYSYINLTSPKGHAHALAAFCSPEHSLYVFFDPHFGQFRFPNKGSFVDFLKKFMPSSKYGKDYKQMALLHITDITASEALSA